MIQPTTWHSIQDTIRAVWLTAGPLVGVLIGAYIANRNQRRQWLLDHRHQEFREVLTAMAEANAYITVRADLSSIIEEIPEIVNKPTKVMGSSVFVVSELKEAGIIQDWYGAYMELRDDHDVNKFTLRVHKIRERTIALAKKML
jgi:hypothetical protein